ncbi:hypothetical protein JG688_00016025, partial [Phytophthora aleatoria]
FSNRVGHSLALDVGSVQGRAYLDIRVRFHSICGNIINLHLIALPLVENKTAGTLFDLCERVLGSIDENWGSKLLSVGTDGEPTMTGHISGLQTRLEEAVRYPIIRVWCGLHQLDLVAHEEYRRLSDDRFVSDLTKLRRQDKMKTQMDTACPRFESTR